MAITGTQGSISIGAQKVAEISSWSLDTKAKAIDVTSFDSNGWAENIAGIKEWSGKADGNFKPTDTAGQVALMNAWLNGTTVTLNLNIDATKKFSGNAFIEYSIDTPVDNKIKFSISFTGTGPLTPTLT